MIAVLLWYLIATLAGLAVLPLVYSLLNGLPDRGYAFARSLGLLLWGYLFWLLGSLGVLRNDLGGQLFALAILLGLSALLLRRIDFTQLSSWFRSHRGYVIWVELLFLLAFAAWAFVRSANPDIFGTEKPMEVAFINSILRSETFPPHDPWLSGYAISYYYFGYVLVAMLAQLSAVPASVAFNLGLAMVFALTAIGSFGLVYNLLAARSAAAMRRTDPAQRADPDQSGDDQDHPGPNPGLALFGPLFVLIVSNIEGFLEVLHARGLFWVAGASGQASSRFWTWLDIADLTEPPGQSLSWLPRLFETGNWWWWRASRVVQDYNFRSDPVQIIDEFPFFAYLLGDLHPHVLAMPFAFLALALALNLLLGGGRGHMGLPGTGLFWNISPPAFLLAALALGGMAFLNTWDWPIYVAIFAGAYVLQAARRGGWGWPRLADFAGLGLLLGLSGLLLYLPFFLGFSSQAGGLLPSLVFLTRGTHLWVMFAPLFVPLFALLAYLWRGYGSRRTLQRGLFLMGVCLGLFTLLVLLLVLAIANLPLFAGLNPLAASAEQIFLANLGAPGWGALLQESLLRRLVYPGGWLTLLLLLIPCAGLLSTGRREPGAKALDLVDEQTAALNPASPMPSVQLFVLLLVLSGGLLVLAPEFFYLRDQFGSRMNTIFKFYFQAWLFWGAAAAYATALLLQTLRGVWGGIFRLGLLLVLGMSLFYPVLSLWDKTRGFNPPNGLTLDGAAYIARHAPQEMAAIEWLRSAPLGVIVEAVRPDGGQYSDFGRVAAHSGMPTVLGWIGHQIQWRGGSNEIGSRQADIERLYTTRSWEEAEQVIRQYNIRYVVVGPRERSTYRLFEPKFDRLLVPVFSQGDMVIYEVPK
jgi:YYY domain-containing protein